MRKLSWRARVGAPIVAVLALAGALVAIVGAPSGAATIGPVDPTKPDNSAVSGSLRNVLENANAGDVIVLQAGATYVLDGDLDDGPCGDVDIDVNAAVTIEGNGATIESACTTNEGGILDTEDNLTINNLILKNGHAVTDKGGAITAFGGNLVVNNSAILDSFSGSKGGGIYHGAVGSTTITNSTVAGNASCTEGGGIYVDNGALTITNSTISNNSAAEVGGILADSPGGNKVTLVYTTLVDNTTDAAPSVCSASLSPAAPDDGHDRSDPPSSTTVGPLQSVAANLELFADGTPPPPSIFGTVIALPHGGTNCGANGEAAIANTDSHGFNYSDDESCGFTGATDKENGSDPLLGPLGANAGIGPTRVPQGGSPLINAIPVANCGDGNALAGFTVTTDERGITRPQETGCEIGAVEVVAQAVVVQPAFTG